MSKYFGTDGIRGQADRFTPDFLGKITLGLAAYAQALGLDHPRVLLGGDTRESSEWILADLAAALETLGIEHGSVAVLPTPGINFCFYQMGFDFAIDVTASHNPYTDNGIKIFERGNFPTPVTPQSQKIPTPVNPNPQKTPNPPQKPTSETLASPWLNSGRKLSPAGVNFIEKALDSPHVLTPVAPEIAESLHADALDRYIAHLTTYISRLTPSAASPRSAHAEPDSSGSPAPDAPSRPAEAPKNSPPSPQPAVPPTSVAKTASLPLSGLHIALDCANGATSVVGARPFELLGATATVINADPSYGQTINRGVGSTHLDSLISAVQSGHYAFGAALDGDGDRCLLVDAAGTPVSGDQILAIFAHYLGLKKLAVTVMANQGILSWAEKSDVHLAVTDVGDANVARAMREQGIVLGGEESGHIILPGQPMGDGLLVALLMAKIVAETGQSLADLAAAVPLFPQLTTNIPASESAKSALRAATAQPPEPSKSTQIPSGPANPPAETPPAQISALLRRYTTELSQIGGRLLVRPSGTEPLVRVTLWGPEIIQIQHISDRLVAEISQIFDQISHI